MTTTELTVDTSLPGHAEAMRLGAAEYQRFIDLIRTLSPDDWSKPTDCPLWDVRATVAHTLGSIDLNASRREMVHQIRSSTKRAKASGAPMVDELTALQVHERATMSPADLLAAIETTAPRAIGGRRRMPSVLRRFAKVETPAPFARMTLGYLLDTIFTRDVWMHRVDISRATGKAMVTTPGHDGRLVAAIVGEWAGHHGQPFDLVLDGPAGGHFHHGEDGEELRLDAIDFCRIVSGRDPANAHGLLATEVLF